MPCPLWYNQTVSYSVRNALRPASRPTGPISSDLKAPAMPATASQSSPWPPLTQPVPTARYFFRSHRSHRSRQHRQQKQDRLSALPWDRSRTGPAARLRFHRSHPLPGVGSPQRRTWRSPAPNSIRRLSRGTASDCAVPPVPPVPPVPRSPLHASRFRFSHWSDPPLCPWWPSWWCAGKSRHGVRV